MQFVKTLLNRARLAALAASVVGTVVFHLLDLPLPFLLGPMFGCLVAALAGAPLKGLGPLATAMRIVLGVAVGTAITPELLERMPQMIYSIALVPPFILIIGLIGYPWFRKVCGFDHPTSYYSAMPGGLQDMLIFGEEAGGNVRTLSLIHATRVLVIVTSAPFLLQAMWGVPLVSFPGASAAEIPLLEMAIMAVAGTVGWLGARAIGLFGAPIIGPLAATALASLAGLVEHRPPGEMLLAAQFILGLGVGAEYVGVTLRELKRDVLAGIGYCVLLSGIALGFAEIVIGIGAAPPMEAFLAFAPGGQSEMAILAIVAGADLAYVVTHHLVRLVVVIIGAPIVARLVR
ncbi:MAG: AbrB family transcriptional regulator [Proteobacteria bacterium]|nr:AbrB family transcriptional regulator [Pseudomonadota bacterium]